MTAAPGPGGLPPAEPAAGRLGFHLDTGSCTGCKACALACKDRHDRPVGVNWRRVVEYGGGAWATDRDQPVPLGVFAYHVSLSCMHCQDPACLSACPTAAIVQRPDGVVRTEPDRCLGCHYCEWACPYGAPQFGPAGTMEKCDFCADLLDQGGGPACVEACPTRALDWGPLERLRAEHGGLQAVAPLPGPEQTRPAVVVTPHRHAQPPGSGAGAVARTPPAPRSAWRRR